MAPNPLPWVFDAELVASDTVLVSFLRALPGMVVVLDQDRRIVWASSDFAKTCRRIPQEILGLRPGEALGCVHSQESPLGCGSTPDCYGCRAVEAILQSRIVDQKTSRTGELERFGATGRESFPFTVSASPWVLDGHWYTIAVFYRFSE